MSIFLTLIRSMCRVLQTRCGNRPAYFHNNDTTDMALCGDFHKILHMKATIACKRKKSNFCCTKTA